MTKVIARKCPFTGTLFDINESKEYAQHLGTVRKELARERFERRAEADFIAFRQELFDYAYTFQDITDWIIANQDRIKMYNDYFYNKKWQHTVNRDCGATVINDFKFSNMRHHELCSNSHNAPLGKETNWGGYKDEDGVPRGYEGFNGRITINFGSAGHSNFDASGIFTKLGISTGSGGGHSDQLGYGVTVWTDDFHHIKTQVDEQRDAWNKNYMIAMIKKSIGHAGYPSFKPSLKRPDMPLTNETPSGIIPKNKV